MSGKITVVMKLPSGALDSDWRYVRQEGDQYVFEKGRDHWRKEQSATLAELYAWDEEFAIASAFENDLEATVAQYRKDGARMETENLFAFPVYFPESAVDEVEAMLHSYGYIRDVNYSGQMVMSIEVGCYTLITSGDTVRNVGSRKQGEKLFMFRINRAMGNPLNYRDPSAVRNYMEKHSDFGSEVRLAIAEQGLRAMDFFRPKGNLNDAQKQALLEAHEYGKGNLEEGYPQGEETVKGLKLMRNGLFTREAAQYLMDAVICGNEPESKEVDGKEEETLLPPLPEDKESLPDSSPDGEIFFSARPMDEFGRMIPDTESSANPVNNPDDVLPPIEETPSKPIILHQTVPPITEGEPQQKQPPLQPPAKATARLPEQPLKPVESLFGEKHKHFCEQMPEAAQQFEKIHAAAAHLSERMDRLHDEKGRSAAESVLRYGRALRVIIEDAADKGNFAGSEQAIVRGITHDLLNSAVQLDAFLPGHGEDWPRVSLPSKYDGTPEVLENLQVLRTEIVQLVERYAGYKEFWPSINARLGPESTDELDVVGTTNVRWVHPRCIAQVLAPGYRDANGKVVLPAKVVIAR